ncbi:glycosyltransferase [Alphaproteobacteria bacterium]|nr:glycosyltransferase [Alphaproteobacteria bacterium]
MKNIYLSVVIPVYNEEESLKTLSLRLMTVLEKIGKSFEVIYTNDGSKDASIKILRDLQKTHPKHVRVIDFSGNYGQHMAIMAAFSEARGEVIINLDGDLQNPPEEIPKLLEKFEEGHDVVGSYRLKRSDHAWRHWGSRFANKVRYILTGTHMKDQGCMFRAYARPIVDQIVSGTESSTFIPVLAWKLAQNPCEVGLRHESREQGDSKYGIYELIRVAIDLATNFSMIPIQFFTFFGMIVSGLSFLLVLYMLVRRVIFGPEAEGVFTLVAIVIFLISVAIMGIGIIGEYVGRIYQSLCRRRYSIRTIIQDKTIEKDHSK